MNFGTMVVHFDIYHICCINDKCEMLHELIFNLGLRNMCVIILCTELLTLIIEDSFEVPSLIEFWGIMIVN